MNKKYIIFNWKMNFTVSESIEFSNNLLKPISNFKNKNALVVHRINECDERKNTNHINNLWIICNKCNTIKSNATHEDIIRFESIAKYLKEFQLLNEEKDV